ncbi:Pr6Pr family membrane protein [Nocardia sp. NPDC052566]|uniref:Pr6Pr family membrane protein n=1 Tax=Nocardia sp. NPDC052566 TaxID=3364330 RepID=UPI0037C8F90F
MSAVEVSPGWVRALRVGFAVLALIALIRDLVPDSGEIGYSVANELSYFTIQSNVIAAVVLLVGGLRDPRDRRWQAIRCAATLYLVITGIVYAVLLSHLGYGAAHPWVNDVLHRVMPIVVVVDWVLVPVALGITERLIGGLLIYPLVYGIYTLIRGPIVDWYPYPFIDPRHQGYVSMTIGLVVLAVGFALLAVAIVALGDLCGRRRVSL